HYSDDELRSIWSAADKLSTVEGAYTKLMMLLALRRDELAEGVWSEFDRQEGPTLFTVPTPRRHMKTPGKLTKKPTDRVPLPPRAARIVRGLRGGGEQLFPGLDIRRKLKPKLVKLGAPKDFLLHTFRHTIATYFHNTGRSEWERALVLN